MKLETTRILKRMDGYAVLLALVLSTAFQSFFGVVYELSARLTRIFGESTEYSSYLGGGNWQEKYLNPVFNCLIWLVAVEVTLQLARYIQLQAKKK